MEKFLRYASRHWDDMIQDVLDHLELCGLSLLIGLAIAVLICLLLMKLRWLRKPVVAVLGALYAIPSMAFFAILIPILGLGKPNAIVVLVIYSQFVLVRNILAGFDGVDRSTLEAARGMGMTGTQMFLRVQLPLALPVIISGIRIAAIVTISSATIAQTINAGGLGVLLFDGLRTVNVGIILWGTILTGALALIVNMLLSRLERYSYRRARGEIVSV